MALQIKQSKDSYIESSNTEILTISIDEITNYITLADKAELDELVIQLWELAQ